MIAAALAGLAGLAWCAIIGVWARLLLEQRRARRDGLLRLPQPPAGADLPSLTVIVPVRDAADAVERCAASVLAQVGVELDLLLVDDRSTDGTGERIDALAAADPRVRAVHVTELPPGWMGKSHAIWSAARHARGAWLLLVDDDCTLEPGAAAAALAEARRRDVGLLSLWPKQAVGTIWEHLIIPLCSGVIAIWYGPRGGRFPPGRAFANGQFLLVERRAYDAAGGHHAVRSALIEDVALARHLARRGVRWAAASGRELIAVRMYDGGRATIAGWARIFVGALGSASRIVASVAWLALGSLLPFLATPFAAVAVWRALAEGRAPSAVATGAALLAAAHLALLGVVSWRFWGLGGCPRRHLLLYPLSVVLVIVILLRALWWLVVRRRVPWRGTVYRIDRRARVV